MARPKKTIDDLPKGWQKKILDLKKYGGSDVEARVALGISVDLWQRFIKEVEEFSETIKKGNDLCEAWWLGKGRKNLENKQFSAVLWYMNMKNRFGWKDKTEMEHSPTSALSALLGQISEKRQKIVDKGKSKAQNGPLSDLKKEGE